MEETTTVVDEEIAVSEMPTWLTELLNRLMQVLTKLLIKLGIKIAL